MGDLSRRVPGRARGELGLFQKHGVMPPAFMGEVIGKAHPHDATANDHHAGMGGKGFLGHDHFLADRVAIFLDRLGEHMYHRQS